VDLTVTAVGAAVADAGLTLADIDGLTSTLHLDYVPGASDPEPDEVGSRLGLEVTWSAKSGNVVEAVASGACRHAVVYRTVKEGSGAKEAGGRPGMGLHIGVAKGPAAFSQPLGALSPVNGYAMEFARHMHDYGTTREQLGWVAVTQRAHAALNPLAVYRRPLTLDEYLEGRMISTPLCIYDCDVPVDASTAFVYSHIETVPDLRAPVRIEAQGLATPTGSPPREIDLWGRTDLRPPDVDVAQFYDGFSPFVLNGLEALGFCNQGESGPFVEGGKRITFGGDLPINTWGGQLSAGRVHRGVGHLVEAVRQVRGECGAHQVSGAEVALYGRGIGTSLGPEGLSGILYTSMR
jgi:acetyl-CoA acetyltransferase